MVGSTGSAGRAAGALPHDGRARADFYAGRPVVSPAGAHVYSTRPGDGSHVAGLSAAKSGPRDGGRSAAGAGRARCRAWSCRRSTRAAARGGC